MRRVATMGMLVVLVFLSLGLFSLDLFQIEGSHSHAFAADGQPAPIAPLQLDDEGATLDTSGRLTWQIDESDTLDAASAAKGELAQIGAGSYVLGRSTHPLWLRVPLFNGAGSVEKWVVMTRAARIHDSLEFWLTDGPPGTSPPHFLGRTGAATTRLGAALPRPMVGAQFLLPRGTGATMLVRIKSSYPIASDLIFIPEVDVAKFADAEGEGFGLYAGIVLFVVALGFVYYIALRDVSYILHSFWCLTSLAIAAAVLGRWDSSLGGIPSLNGSMAFRVMPALTSVAATSFLLTFLEVRRASPRLFKIHCIYTVLIVLNSVLWYFGTAPQIFSSVTMFLTLTRGVLFIATWRVLATRHKRDVHIVLVAIGGYYISIFVQQLAARGVIPYIPKTAWAMVPGQLFEMLVLTVSLIGRVRVLEASRARAEGAAREADLLRGLLRVLSHDLSNPLTVINGYAQLSTTRHHADEALAGPWRKVAQAAKAQQEILRHVRKMRAVAEGRAELDVSSVPVAEAFNEAARLFEGQIFEKRLVLVIDADPAALCAVADRSSITYQVFANVLSNAIKFTPDGRKVLVRFSSERATQPSVATVKHGRETATAAYNVAAAALYIVVEVEDEGVGIPPDVIQSLFSSGQSSSRVGTRGEPGTGFGLSIVKAYVERFGGSVEVCSLGEEGRGGRTGTVVRLRLKAPEDL